MRRSGMTLIELLIAVAIGLGLTAVVLTLMMAQSRAMTSSQGDVEAESGARVALEALARDIRNAGFLLPSYQALRIEDNCGSSPTGGPAYPGIDVVNGQLSVPGNAGSAVGKDGQYKGDQVSPGVVLPDGCPNGSDRITMMMRPRNDFLLAKDPGEGNSLHLDFDCTRYGGDCSQAFSHGGITGTTCNVTTMSNPVDMCAANDPTQCYPVQVQPDSGKCSCAIPSTACRVNVFSLPSGNPFQTLNGGQGWTLVGGKNNASFGAYRSRTYELMDVDGSGQTSLVYSDDVNDYLATGLAGKATWTPVAYDIDDLQVSYSYANAPNVFVDKNYWNISTCTSGVHDDCAFGMSQLQPPNMPVALRVTIVARSQKKVFSGSNDRPDQLFRTQIENNNPLPELWDPLSVFPNPAFCFGTQPCGCGAATRTAYLTCSGHGNAQGFRRRVLTQIIALRNVTPPVF